MKKFLSLAVLGVTAAALTLATPAVSFAGWHHGGGHYHSYHYRGHHYRGHRYWYTTRYDYCAPAPVCATECLARIRVLVPCNAKVWIDGQETAQTGSDRLFESPPLTPGRDFTYCLKTSWCGPDGKEITITRQVGVQANASVLVDFTQPAA